MKDFLFKLPEMFIINLNYDLSFISIKEIKLSQKISYILHKYFSILTNKREIIYLNKRFSYDTLFSPVHLQEYPSEVLRLNSYINLKKINSVLDIGANIGQFAFTLITFFPNIKIYSFEPNPFVYKTLNSNLSFTRNFKSFPYALGGRASKRKFFFSEEASAEGSFYASNLNQNYKRGKVHKIQVDVKNLDSKTITQLNLPKRIDLVKIDVEGAELEALKSLNGISFRYLYIEVSVNRKGATLKDIISFVEKKYRKDTKVIFTHLPHINAPAMYALIELLDKGIKN